MVPEDLVQLSVADQRLVSLRPDGKEIIVFSLLLLLQPLGPLDFTYHQPLAELGYEFAKFWSINAYWNYDQYNEGSFVGPTNPRYFHDNRTMLSLKYAF